MSVSLPNVYYGDMGQTVVIRGDHCGYSFDHLISLNSVGPNGIALTPDIDWSNARGRIPASDLLLIQEVDVDGNRYKVYRIVCDPSAVTPWVMEGQVGPRRTPDEYYEADINSARLKRQ